MIFASDNWAGAHPSFAAGLLRHACGFAAANGTGDLDKKIEQKFNTVFKREVAVFFVGTATNALTLASVNRPRRRLVLTYDVQTFMRSCNFGSGPGR
jgi:threonine aldolase